MIDTTVLPAFIAMILAFLIPPGPDMMFMIAIGLQGGRTAAIKGILGIGTGMAFYAAAVTLGLGLVTARAPWLLSALMLLGAVYLLTLAWSSLRRGRDRGTQLQDAGVSERWYLRGLTVSLTNPKIILFFMAVLPQFTGTATSIPAQLAFLGAVNVMTEVLLYGGIGVFAGTFRNALMRNRGAQAVLNYVAALTYLGLAIFIVFDVLSG